MSLGTAEGLEMSVLGGAIALNLWGLGVTWRTWRKMKRYEGTVSKAVADGQEEVEGLLDWKPMEENDIYRWLRLQDLIALIEPLRADLRKLTEQRLAATRGITFFALNAGWTAAWMLSRAVTIIEASGGS